MAMPEAGAPCDCGEVENGFLSRGSLAVRARATFQRRVVRPSFWVGLRHLSESFFSKAYDVVTQNS